ALRSLCRGGNLLEPVGGAWPVRNHVPIARTGKSSDQRSQARAGRGRGALLLTVACRDSGCLQRAVGWWLGHGRWRSFPPSLQKGGGLRPLLGVGSPKHLRVGHVSVV